MSINYDLIRQLRAELKEYIKEKIAAGVIKYGLYSRSTASGEGDAIRGYQTDGPDEQSYDFAGRRVFPFGIRSRPPSGTWGVWIGKGGRSGDGVIVGAESSRFGPSNLNDGEVAIYNKVTGCTILLDQNGNVVINGGTLKVARVSDPVNVGTLAVAAPVGGGACTVTFTPKNADGTPGTPTTTGVITAAIANSGGASNFKG